MSKTNCKNSLRAGGGRGGALAGPDHKHEPWAAQVSTQAISGRHGSDSAAVMAESTVRALALRRGGAEAVGPLRRSDMARAGIG